MGGWGAGPLFSDINVWELFFEGGFKGWWLWCLTKLVLPLIIFSFEQLELIVDVSLQHVDDDDEDDDDVLDSTNCIPLLLLFAAWLEFPAEYADKTVVVIAEGCCWCTMFFWEDEAETNWLSVVEAVVGL